MTSPVCPDATRSPVELAEAVKRDGRGYGKTTKALALALLDAEKTLQGISDETTELRIRARANRALSVPRGSG